MSRRSNRIAAAILAPPTPIGTTAIIAAVAITANKVTKTSKTGRASKATDNKENSDDNNEGAPEGTAPKKKRKVAATAKEPELSLLGDGKTRCIWADNPRYPLLQAYHDEEWNHSEGFNHTNRYLFELLILEGAQAGLSWSTVLHKREAYREAYHQFDYHRIATTYKSPADNDRLLQTNIVKNKLKVQASMVNAKAFCELLEELYPDQTGLDDEMGFWMFLQDYKKKSGKSKREPTEYLTRSAESDRLSEDLKKRGFKFVGSTIMYAYLQAAGIEQDGIQHTTGCFRHHKN
ncbi:MAG: Methyladenine glycosylase-domain-containing protein [Linnemannia elongata]|nr:MAG: Methyladenine glycosylase-domain-containing protein [Linnemannia elongata]